MAYKKTGTVSNDEVGINDPKSILISAPGAASVVTLSSTEGGVEMTVAAPAGGSFFLVRSGSMVDHFPMGKDLKATITGDGQTFVRIDG